MGPLSGVLRHACAILELSLLASVRPSPSRNINALMEIVWGTLVEREGRTEARRDLDGVTWRGMHSTVTKGPLSGTGCL